MRSRSSCTLILFVVSALAYPACTSDSDDPSTPDGTDGPPGSATDADAGSVVPPAPTADADVDGVAPPPADGGDLSTPPVTGCSALDPLPQPPEQLFVAPNGDDSAAGTAAAPLKTLRAAAKRFPTGGTVIVRGGTYPAEKAFSAIGTEGHPLFVRAADGELPVFDGGAVSGSWSAVIQLTSANHAIFSGLEIRNCMADSCQGVASNKPVADLTLRGNTLHHLSGPAARFAGTKIRLEGNTIHDVALTNQDNVKYPGGGWPTCFGTTPDFDNGSKPWATDVVIRGNHVKDCWGEGIGLWYAADAVVEDNVVDNAWNVGIYGDNAFNLRIARNFVSMRRGNGGGQGGGVVLGIETYSGLANVRTHDVVIENNVIVAGTGISWWAMSTSQSTYDHVTLAHNTVKATQSGAIGFSAAAKGAPTPSDSILIGNVLAETKDGWLNNHSAFTSSGNAWLNKAPPSYIAGKTDVRVDAKLGTISTATDVQPLATVVGTVPSATGVATDFACAARDPDHPTRGAFEK